MKLNSFFFIISAVTVILFLIPFLWLKPGLTDLGGDSSRLYYYQPLEYLKNQSLYAVSKSGLGGENLSFYGLPHFLLLAGLKFILRSPTLLIDVIYGLNLSLGFLFCFLIISEVIKDLKISEQNTKPAIFAAIIAALYYILPPQLNSGWAHVILTFNQVFLNPLIFYLLFKFMTSRSFRYLAAALFITLIFSPNFSYVGAPPFFAFYPLSLLFLVLYTKLIRKQAIPWKGIFLGLGLFILLHAFHIVPIVVNIFNPASVNARELFSKEAIIDRGLGYFTGIAGSVKVSFDILGLQQLTDPNFYALIYIIFPFLILLGFLKNKSRTLLLSGFFFLIALFFVTAKITNIGFAFYKTLFYVPGFSMFRNFTGQWRYLYLFFYALLLGQSLFIVFANLPKKQLLFSGAILLIILIVPAWPFIRGDYINKSIHWQSNQVKTTFRMDPDYEAMLSVIRSLPNNGKVLTLPLTDPGYQIIKGIGEGAYEGPSTIAYLTSRQDFTGYGELGVFKDFFVATVKNRDYKRFGQLLQLFNIKYIFYNADPLVYDSSFPYQPYTYMRSFFPETQAGYRDFLSKLPLELVDERAGKYFLYRLPEKQDIHEIYLARGINYFDKLTDWSVPLSLTTALPDGPAFFQYKYKPPLVTNDYLVAVPDSTFTQVLKNPKPPLVLLHAFATTPPSSLLYPLIVAREELTLRLKGKTDESYLDNRFLLAAKRVLELEHWGSQMKVTIDGVRNINDLTKYDLPTLWSRIWQNHNQFEAVLAKYVRYIEQNIQRIDGSSRDENWKEYQKFIVSEYLMQHRSRLIRIIPELSKSDEEKKYLNGLLDLVFSYLFNKLNYLPLDQSKVSFSLPDLDTMSPYEIEMESGALTNHADDISLKIGDKTLTPQTNQQPGEWINFGTINLKDGKKTSSLELMLNKQENLIKNANQFSIENTDYATDSASFSINASLIGGNGGLIWKITDWRASGYYLLSFDYKTHDASFFVRIVNSQSDGTKAGSKILEDELSAHAWQHYQAVVKADNFTDVGFVQFAGGSIEAPISRLELRNLNLYEIPHPYILFRRIENKPPQNIFPTMTFTKVNPSKYLVHIVNRSSRPFILVLNQQYNAQWKIYQTPKANSLQNLLDIFWPFKGLSEKDHYEVNGYGNAWYISSEDIGNKTDYTLTIEMTAQNIFYSGLVVLTAGILLLTYFGLRPPKI